jgi:hypothetical protein
MPSNFELVKIALDELFEVVDATTFDAQDELVAACAELSAKYKTLTDSRRTPVDYSSPVARFAYLYTYTASHASWVAEVLTETDETSALLESDAPLRVTCLGGGPGSELIGLLKACKELEREEPVSCFLLDSEDSWSETWAEVDQQIEAPFKVSTSFRCVNVLKPPKYENLAKAFDADLFLSIFFLSEIYAFRDRAQPFFTQLAQAIKPGALVVYIDNSSEQFTQFATSIFTPAMFETLRADDNAALQLSPTEEKAALGRYLDLIGRPPKLGSRCAVRVWRKKRRQ